MKLVWHTSSQKIFLNGLILVWSSWCCFHIVLHSNANKLLIISESVWEMLPLTGFLRKLFCFLRLLKWLWTVYLVFSGLVWQMCEGRALVRSWVLTCAHIGVFLTRWDLSYILHYLCDFQWHFSTGTGVVICCTSVVECNIWYIWFASSDDLVWLSCSPTRIFPPKIENWFWHPPRNTTDGTGWQTLPPVSSQMPTNQDEQSFLLPHFI